MELIRNHRLYEDFIDILDSDDLQSASVENDDDIIATNYIRLVVNGINTNNPLRKDYKLYIDAIKKFDRILRKSFSMIPYIKLASNNFCIILNSKKNFKEEYDAFKDNESGFSFKNKKFDSVAKELKDASEFMIEYKANINVPGASWVRFMINFYEIGTACAKKCFMGGKLSQYNMDPTNYHKPHGMFVWYDKILDVIHRKNDEGTKRYVINFGKLVTGNNYKDYILKWFKGTAYTNEQKFPPFVYSVLKRFRLDYNNVFLRMSDEKVVFVDVPKDETMETESASLKFMLDKCEETGYRMFFTIDGTLKAHMNGDNLVWKDRNNVNEGNICPFAEFFQHCVFPNVNIIRIDWYNPKPASFRCYDAVDFTLLYIKELYVKFGKYTPSPWHNDPYVQPHISLNSLKPNILKITDENKKTGTK